MNQTPSEPNGPTAPTNARRRRGRAGRFTAGAAGALVLTAGLGTLALAQTSTEADPTSATADAGQAGTSNHRPAPATTDIDDLTLGELAEELERLGLEVRITDADADVADPEIDPFDGMTDAEIDALSDEEFFELLERAGIEPDWEDEDGWGDDDNGDHEGHDHGADEAPLATAEVDGDRLDTSGLSPEVAEQALRIWNRFVQLIPADQRQMVSAFELLGEDYQGAHVYPEDDDPSRWVLGVGLGLGEDLDYVLIHEFAHLLTLQAEEVPPSADYGSCPTYHTGEGCALRGSTMAEFVKRFWPQDMRDAIDELYESEDEAAFEAFYQERKDQFVTDYAATNPAEDLAETFAHFVTEDRPTGDSIAEQKVQMLWADADLVELRAQIRSALG